MLINTFLDTEDFVHLYYTEDEPPAPQGCGAGARMASKYPQRPPSPDYTQVPTTSSVSKSERERCRAPPMTEPRPAHRVGAADMYPVLHTHYDEPGLEVGFSPICGESVQWVGRTADGTIAMSNYRLHVQPRRRSGPGASMPLRTIDAVEVRDLLHLLVLCKHGRTLKCTFNTGEQCLEWSRRINSALVPLSSLQDTFAAAHAAWAKEKAQHLPDKSHTDKPLTLDTDWFGPEVQRLGFTANGAWRISNANSEYKLCASYPRRLVVPASIGDDELDFVARFRAMRRLPAVVWRYRNNGAVIARSSQPEVGWLGWRSPEDERLLAAFVSACNADRGHLPPNNVQSNMKLLVMDARSYTTAVTNRARGGGCECQQYYPAAEIQFMSLPNIHTVRRSFIQMRALIAEPGDQVNWHSNLERSLWLQYVSGVCRAASVVARALLAGRPVLVHCSDGWDRTPQIVATAQLLLDPYYRTVQGFRVLIEREWLDFGHKFADRCGHQFGAEDLNERSPIFLQWLDVVYQIMHQNPCSFEFNEAYLIKLATHVHSCLFGTFVCNTGRERAELRVHETTAHVWRLLAAPAYRNHLYCEPVGDQVLWPDHGMSSMRFWWAMYAGERDMPSYTSDPETAQPRQLPGAQGLMTKTRSCDNLVNEGERRTTQRRCSDPSIAPDVMKLSSIIMGGECEARRGSRLALTDSCVDDLPLLPLGDAGPAEVNIAEVDGMHPDHFEGTLGAVREPGSGSSSLERELGAAAATATGGAADADDELERHAPAYRAHSPAPAARRDLPPGGGGARPIDIPDGPVYDYDAFGDVTHLAKAAREAGRTRNMSITWPRSVSESSNQSSNGFDISDGPMRIVDEPSVRNGSHDAAADVLDGSHDASADVLDGSHDASADVLNGSHGPPANVHNGSHEASANYCNGSHEESANGHNGSHEASEDVCNDSHELPANVHNGSPETLANGRNGSYEASSEIRERMHEASPADRNVNGELTNHNRQNGAGDGAASAPGHAPPKTDGDLNNGASSSSISSESEDEGAGAGAAADEARRPRAPRGRVASLLTLCPASPRRSATSGIETSGESSSEVGCRNVNAPEARTAAAAALAEAVAEAAAAAAAGAEAAASARCMCGAGGSAAPAAGDVDPLDGLAPVADRVQARLHQIILSQKRVVDGLMGELRHTKELLRQAKSQSPDSGAHAAASGPPAVLPPAQMETRSASRSGSGSACGSRGAGGSGSGSSSSSASEVEVGEEARGVVWLPDSAAQRCQNCQNQFWLARRRHHCRRCGGIFCGSCSEMSPWGEASAVRVCRRCRALR